MSKLFLELSHELLPDLGLFIVRLKLVSLRGAGVAPDRADVDHAVPELDKRPALDGYLEVGNVVQDEFHQLLVRVLADVLDEAVRGELLIELVRCQAVLGKGEVEELERVPQLLGLFWQVGAADGADGDLAAEGVEGREDFGGCRLCVRVSMRV